MATPGCCLLASKLHPCAPQATQPQRSATPLTQHQRVSFFSLLDALVTRTSFLYPRFVFPDVSLILISFNSNAIVFTSRSFLLDYYSQPQPNAILYARNLNTQSTPKLATSTECRWTQPPFRSQTRSRTGSLRRPSLSPNMHATSRTLLPMKRLPPR